MWKLFNDSQSVYMVKLEKSDNDYNTFYLLLTDLTYLWKTCFSITELQDLFRETNKHIGATKEQVLSYLKELLENIQNASILVENVDDFIHLTLESTCPDLDNTVTNSKISYKFKFTRGDQNKFTENITVPAIKTIFFLEKQQEMLVNIIRKKDMELKQFELEKLEMSRSELKTEKFDQTQVESEEENMLEKVFTKEESAKFWNKFTEIHGQTKSTTLDVQLEPWNQQKRRKVVYSGKNEPKFLTKKS